MRSVTTVAGFCGLFLSLGAMAACGGGQSLSAVDTLVVSSEDTAPVCPTAVRGAIQQVRGVAEGDAQAVPMLDRATTWATSHLDVECNPANTARILWQQSLAALDRVGTTDAQIILVRSLASSHRPGSMHDRHNAEHRRETLTVLRSLQQASPLDHGVIEALLAWYGQGAADCSIDAHRARVVTLVVESGDQASADLANDFPPTGGARCAPGWLLVDIFETMDESHREAAVEQIIAGRGLAQAVRATSTMDNAIQRALMARDCGDALSAVEGAFSQGQPQIAVEEAMVRCGASEQAAERIQELQRRLSTWLIGRGEAEEAWAELQSLPPSTVDGPWRFEVGSAVITARLDRGALEEAVAILEELESQPDRGDQSFVPLRTQVSTAFVSAASERLDSGGMDEAAALLTRAEAVGGAPQEVRRVRLAIDLGRVAAVLEADPCLERSAIRALADRTAELRGLVVLQHEGDQQLQTLADDLHSRVARLRPCRR